MADDKFKLFKTSASEGYYQPMPLPVIRAVTILKCSDMASVIIYQCMVNQSRTVSISNVMAAKWGITRATKERQLIKLEKAKFISMRQAKGKATLVTWLLLN
jgi:hypothetical protein